MPSVGASAPTCGMPPVNNSEPIPPLTKNGGPKIKRPSRLNHHKTFVPGDDRMSAGESYASGRADFMECGGKRSATPLWLGRARAVGRMRRRASFAALIYRHVTPFFSLSH